MPRKTVVVVAAALVPVALWIACSRSDIRAPGDPAIADGRRTEDWLAYGRTHSEQRYSPLDDINRETVRDLGGAWYMDLPNDVGLASTPLVVGGILYFASASPPRRSPTS